MNGTARTQALVFKNKSFSRLARRSRLSDDELCRSVRDAERGLIAADLGGGVIKQRVARRGAGKSGGFRVLILFRARELAFFVHGFAKNDVENIGPEELVALRRLAAEMLSYRESELLPALASGTIIEVKCNGQNEATP
ncbi:MAG: type II toxin-antitoxin system RelE/ParE family toxin [Terracidiphilus sp.]